MLGDHDRLTHGLTPTAGPPSASPAVWSVPPGVLLMWLVVLPRRRRLLLPRQLEYGGSRSVVPTCNSDTRSLCYFGRINLRLLLDRETCGQQWIDCSAGVDVPVTT